MDKDNKYMTEEELEEKLEEEKEEKYEEKFFDESDNKKAVATKAVIAIVAVFILIIIVVLLLVFGHHKSTSSDVSDSIEDYQAVESEESVTDASEDTQIFDRNDTAEETNENTEATPEVIVTPEPSDEAIPERTEEGYIMEEDKDYSKVKFNTKNNLAEMESYFADGNAEAVSDLAHLDRYIAMSYSFKDTTDYAYYGDVNADGKPDGKGIAVYADNQYYYGDWSNGVREGGGTWIHFHIHTAKVYTDPIIYHQYSGAFVNDLPEGEGQEHYEYDSTRFKEGQRYFTNYLGSYKEGRINGEFYCITTSTTDEYAEWEGTATEGSFDYLSEARDQKNRGPVLYNTENPDDCIFMSPNENQKLGVDGYISSNKK